MTELKPCPFCGDEPEFPDYEGGTWYEDLGCCFAYVSVQISDLMTIEEREGQMVNFQRVDEGGTGTYRYDEQLFCPRTIAYVS